MKKLLFSILLILSFTQLFAQSEKGKHEVSVNLLDIDLVINSSNRVGKALLGTGLIYSYWFNDLLAIETGISSYETNVVDDCRFCFFFNQQSGKGFYTNKEFRLGLKMEKPSRRVSGLYWLMGATMKYGRADYRAILEGLAFAFDPNTGEPLEVVFITDRDVTTRYIAGGLDLGFKIYPNNHMFIAFVSNVSTVVEFNLDNTSMTTFMDNTLSGNFLELRTGIRF